MNDKQMNKALVKNDEDTLFTSKKRHRFRQYSGGGSK